MANRIITFQLDPIQKRLQDNPLEVFLDVSLKSENKPYIYTVTHIIPPILEANYVTLKAEDDDQEVEFILDEENTGNDYTRILTYINPSDYEDFKYDDDIIDKYYAMLATDPNNENSSYVLTDPAPNGQYIALLSSDEYTTDTKIYTEQRKLDNFSIKRLVNVNAIRNSLKNIFSWTPGERVLLPEFGSNLRKLLYEGITDYNVEQIIAEIKHIITKWEPRIQIVSIVDASTVDDHENNTVHIKIIFIIPGLSDEQFEYDYVLPIAEYY